MDHSHHNSSILDPDYESYNSAVELNVEEDKAKNLLKLKGIIEEEYNKQVSERQDQIEHIELQICRARKLLHLLRYAIITSYYKKKELEYNGEEEASTSITAIPDQQNRIHPAVKKLLGKNVKNLDHLHIRDKRRSKIKAKNNLSKKKRSMEEVEVQETKKIKLEPPKLQVDEEQEERISTRNRKKAKHRIIIGNISKWSPSLEEDHLTHKWMVYVRGPKETPDVSHIVEKAVFYLHPSYKPYDVVEVCESPFHLSRRGWGEFPVRVQIFFKDKMNKPIDVVHNIKLDKTYTGRQTLGNETVVDVFLYENETTEIKTEKVEIKNEETRNDHCDASLESINLDHSYCLEENAPKMKQEKIIQDESNSLIYGLDESYQDVKQEKQIRAVIPLSNLNQFLQLNRKDIKFNNTKIIVFGKKIDVLANFSKLVRAPAANSFTVSLPKNRFKNVGEALPYMFKNLPLVRSMASYPKYKKLYPFTALNLKEFASWNFGKRRSSEWSRARVIKNMLQSEYLPGIENWTTKAILMYGRSHQYTPLTSYGLFKRDCEEKTLITNCYQNSKVLEPRPVKKEEHINVDSDTEITSPKKSTKPVVDISDHNLKLECTYVRQSALDVGIVLRSEEIDEGVVFNGAERMIFEAVKCLADNLIRRAAHYNCQNGSNSAILIEKDDVNSAINERIELLAVSRFKNERKRFEYFL